MLVTESGAELFSWAKHTNVECVRHSHAHLEIIIVTEGVLDMRVRNADYRIKEGQGIFVSAFEPHEFHSPSENRCKVIMFSRELASKLSEYLKSKKVSSHIFAVSESSRALAKTILSPHDRETNSFETQALLSSLCLDIVEGCTFEDGRHVQEDSLERAFKYINDHFSENISLESVARAIGLHPVTLSKTFSQKMGVSFNASVKCIRCTHAAAAIKGGDATFTEIAMACGFGSVRSFNRNFREIFGLSPTEYRECGEII